MLLVSDILRRSLSGEIPATDGPRFGRTAPVVVWNINKACNMACPHCYASAKLNPVFDCPDENQFQGIIENLARAGIKVLVISGGEPLLKPGLSMILKEATARGMHCHLSSNGSLINATRALELKAAGIKYAGVSIDGLPGFNDSYRRLDNGFLKAARGLQHLRRAGIRTGLRITLSSQNDGQALELFRFACRQKIDRFYLSHLVDSGRGRGFARFDLSGGHTRSLMEKFFKAALEQLDETTNMVTGGNDADGIFLYHFIKRELGKRAATNARQILLMRGGNSAGEKMINIDSEGKVHPDQFWQDATMGNVLNEELSDILKNPDFQWLKTRQNLLKGKCSRCSAVLLCRGSHRGRALARTGDALEADPACYLAETEINCVDFAEINMAAAIPAAGAQA